MSSERTLLVAMLLALPLIAGCSHPSNDPSAVPPSSPASTKATSAASIAETTASREDAKACELVTAQEMSAILGSAVVGTEPAHKSSGTTACSYRPTSADTPGVDFSVTWEDGEIAMRAAGAMGKIEPGITNPYAGIGDRATAIGPELWILNGRDLIKLTFHGVDNVPAKAKKIFDTAKARMN